MDLVRRLCTGRHRATRPRSAWRAWLALPLAVPLAAATPALAAGGHHDVDDATVLDAGHCLVEAWAMQWHGPSSQLQHLGSACHLAGVEWGMNLDRLRDGQHDTELIGPQAKLAWELLPQRLSLGASLGVSWRSRGDGRALIGAALPLTLWLGPDGALQLHANLGQDRDPAAGVFRRLGIAADWSVNTRWVLTAERRFQFGAALSRAGLRFNLDALSSLDLSLARGSGQRVLALGYSVEWAR